MTSKEALENLMKAAITCFPRAEKCIDNCFEYYKLIKKDLETLEILKSGCKEIVSFFESTSKVREWYDNEKRKGELENER